MDLKLLINLLWAGTLLTIAAFGVRDFLKSYRKHKRRMALLRDMDEAVNCMTRALDRNDVSEAEAHHQRWREINELFLNDLNKR